MHKRFYAAVILFAWLTSGLAHSGELDRQRTQFLAAEHALEQDRMDEFARLEKGLRDYPLHPYLVYAALAKRLDELSPREVRQFLDTHAGTPLAWRLRNAWLDRLAREKRWKDYVAFYEPESNVARQCLYLQALIHTGQKQKALAEVEQVWLHGKSQPDACDPVFAEWTRAGMRTPQRIWQRIEKAMHAGQPGLARYLARDLTAADQALVQTWIALYQKPESVADADRLQQAHPYREPMIAHAVRRLALSDGRLAMQQWKSLKPRFPFSEAETRQTEHYIARLLVRESDPEAYSFLKGIDVDAADDRVHEARVRAALMREDWPQVASWIEAMPVAQRSEMGWQYWLARALEATGQQDKANQLYAAVARDRGYYGFLAADRIGTEYHLAHAPTPLEPGVLNEVARMDGVRRARELFALERWTDARREWRDATATLDGARLKAAAKLAEQHGWLDRAIFTLAKTGYWDDLELRFPLRHAELVEENAARHGIDNAWVFAVMRQESAFMDNARSHAGAMGLMQLMPATARNVARQVLKRRAPRRSELFEPDTNIALGSAYLGQMKARLGDSAMLATAAYNAGPHRVMRWLPERTLPADIWVELVPFNETRGYLRRVMAYTVIYEKRMGRNPTRMSDRMHPVAPDLGSPGVAENTTGRLSAG
ncbi:MAG: transglycosylase SLT domain-containing protein [Gammaproteobacteria bacterium]|nr:transglycosylase SLT domain-containing protein [Gammaproteobacteria bacterium]